MSQEPECTNAEFADRSALVRANGWPAADDSLPTEDRQLISQFVQRGQTIIGSLDLTKPSQADLIARLMADKTEGFRHTGSITIRVLHWLGFLGDTALGDGEVERRLKVRLIDTDGQVYGFSSRITMESWAVIVATKGNGPWPEGLPVQVEARAGRQAGYYYLIVPVVDVRSALGIGSKKSK